MKRKKNIHAEKHRSGQQKSRPLFKSPSHDRKMQHLSLDIERTAAQIKLLRMSLSELLLGRVGYIIDEMSPMITFKPGREKIKDYLLLSPGKQKEYCQTLTFLREQYYHLARLYEAKSIPWQALYCHYQALFLGRVNILFSHPVAGQSSAPNTNNGNTPASSRLVLQDYTSFSSVESTDVTLPPYFWKESSELYAGMSHLFGVGKPQDYHKAKALLSLSCQQYPQESHFLLGLMHFYGLGGAPDLTTAKFHFKKAGIDHNPLASQYLAFCELEDGKFRKARSHLKPALKAGLPEAQVTMGLMYEQGCGMFFSHHKKAQNLYGLVKKQREVTLKLMLEEGSCTLLSPS